MNDEKKNKKKLKCRIKRKKAEREIKRENWFEISVTGFFPKLLVFTRYSAVYVCACVCVHACVCVSLCVYLQVADCVNVGSNNLDVVCLQASLEILESVVLHSTGKQSVVEQSVTSQNIIPHLERWARQFRASISKMDSLQHASDAQACVQYSSVQLYYLCVEKFTLSIHGICLCVGHLTASHF